MEYVKHSKEMESLQNLMSNLNLEFRIMIKSKDGVSTTIGNMSRRVSDEIIADSIPPEPQVISVPDLPYSYEELMMGENQYEMIKFVLVLVQLYIGAHGVLGEGNT